MQENQNGLGPDREIGSWFRGHKHRIRDGHFQYQDKEFYWHKFLNCETWDQFIHYDYKNCRSPQDDLARKVAEEVGAKLIDGRWTHVGVQKAEKNPPEPFQGTFAFTWDASTKTLKPVNKKVEVKELTKDEKFAKFFEQIEVTVVSFRPINDFLYEFKLPWDAPKLAYFHDNEWRFVTEDELKKFEAERVTGRIFDQSVGDVLVHPTGTHCWVVSKHAALHSYTSCTKYMWHDHQWKNVKLTQEIHHEFV